MHKKFIIQLVLLLAFLIIGCDTQPALQELPEVNDVNCQLENIQKIQDKATREEFAGKCSRRSIIRPTENPKNVLEFFR